MSTNKAISVIIVTYNSEKHIYDCLDSLFKYNDINDALEVIIVDNQSDNFANTKISLEEKYADKLVIVENDRNGGYGQGNNVGIRISSAPIILIMNPDVRLVMPIFQEAIKAFKNPDVVEFGMRQLNKEMKTGYSYDIVPQISPLLRKTLMKICNKFQIFNQNYMYLMGACFFINKAAFFEIGMFDERIFMYGEEEDIHYRFKKKKDSIIQYNKNLCYAHLHGLYSTSSNNNCIANKMAFKNKLMIYGERGLQRKNIIKSEIHGVKLSLIKLQIEILLFRDEKKKSQINDLKVWLKELDEMLNHIHQTNVDSIIC